MRLYGWCAESRLLSEAPQVSGLRDRQFDRRLAEQGPLTRSSLLLGGPKCVSKAAVSIARAAERKARKAGLALNEQRLRQTSVAAWWFEWITRLRSTTSAPSRAVSFASYRPLILASVRRMRLADSLVKLTKGAAKQVPPAQEADPRPARRHRPDWQLLARPA